MFKAFLGATAACALSGAAAAQPAQAPLSLRDAIVLAHTAAPDLAAAAARVAATRDARPFAGRPLNPAVEVRSENWLSGASDPGLPLDVFATVTQTVELGGKRAARQGLATAAVTAAEAAQATATRAVALYVSRQYLEALRLRERAIVLEAQAVSLTEATRVMRRRVELGTAPESELLKLRTEEARASLERTQATLGAARAVVLLGTRIGADVTLDRLQMPALPPLPAGDKLQIDALAELQLARSAAQTAAGVLDLERARGVPDVAVNAGVKRTAGYTTGVAAVTMAMPIFDRNRVARVVAAGQLRAAQLEAEAVERRLRGEFAAARAAAVTLADRAAWSPAALVEPARAARDAARAAFAAGAIDVLRLLDAERVHTDAAAVSLDIAIDAVAAAIDARVAAGEDPLP
jgi:cobalt-zinc-cadmium efflux system outer membrane protein